jgi:hypothetical protein
MFPLFTSSRVNAGFVNSFYSASVLRANTRNEEHAGDVCRLRIGWRNMYNPALKNGWNPGVEVRPSSQKIKTLLDQAVEFMRNSKDPGHGLDHISNLLKETDRFFKSTGNEFKIDREILVLSLYWHDVWKSQIKPNWRNYLFLQLYEGLGSMFMFKTYARSVDLPLETIRSVSYAIRKHSAVQGLRAKTLEAQLLWDVDTLDIWNTQRTRAALQNMGRVHIPAFDAYIRYVKKAGSRLYFDWTRNEVSRIAPMFFEEMSKFRESLVNGHILF